MKKSITVFNKETFHFNKEFLITYITAILIGCIFVIGTYFLQNMFIYDSAIFILFLPLVLISAWYKGTKAGILTLFIETIGELYLVSIKVSPLNSLYLIKLVILIFESIIFILILDRFKNSQKIDDYKKREQDNLKKISILEKDLNKAELEIRARDEFLSIASHELKTPLTSMLLQLQAALHNIRNVSLANFSVENLMKMLDSTEKQSKRLSKMINDLLNVSLITTGKLHLELEEVDLVGLTKEVIDHFAERAKREGYKITLEADKDIKGNWDRLRIEQVLTNLISNAIKYGKSKPIKIKLKKIKQKAQILIEDHGIGIEEDKLDVIFNRFERATNSSDYRGLGVGLYITRQIIAAHGGSIDVDSEFERGTVFKVELPLQPPKVNA